MAFFRVSLCALSLTLIACGGSSTGNGPGDEPDADTTASGDCTTSDDCVAPEVCQPISQTCESPGAACSGQSDCTSGNYCEDSAGVCLPSSVGTPCDGPDNCSGECVSGVCGCDGVNNERQLEGSPLDIFLMLDRTGSMGTDCAYNPSVNPTPPQSSKACYATYALADYLINVSPSVDTRLALDDMSHHNDCSGTQHDDPEVGLTQLPVLESSTLVQDISDENFGGGFGTQIEGALRGIASYTANNQTAGREMIGVLLTDGDANDCDTNIDNLAQVISDHRTATGLRTFIIGMTGATEANLETLAIAGGADPHMDYCGGLTPPCHYFNVGNGSGDVLAQALQAISQQAVDIPCEIDVTTLNAPEGSSVDYSQVNVTFNDGAATTTIGQVADAGSCPTGQSAWYYDNPSAPTTIQLCDDACTAVSEAGDGANLNVVAGCTSTFVIE